MNNKLEDATIKALQGKVVETNENKIHILIGDISDNYYNNVDDAIADINDTYGSLVLDDPYCAEYIYYPILDWLMQIKDGDIDDTEYIVSQDEFDKVDEIRDEDPNDYYNDNEPMNDNGTYYDENIDDRVWEMAYKKFVKYAIEKGNDTNKVAKQKIKLVRDYSNGIDDEKTIIDEFPSAEAILNEIDNDALVVINHDFAFGKSADIISLYVQYCNDKDDAMINCYNLPSNTKKAISNIKNAHKPIEGSLMYMGVDSQLLYDNDARNHFVNIYNEMVKNKNYFECYIHYLK